MSEAAMLSAEERPSAEEATPVRTGNTTASILIIDDEAGIRDSLETLLTLEGFSVELATEGRSGLDMLARRAYDLLLLDLALPGESGIDLLPRIKNLAPQLPIIMITAYGDAQTKRQALENGAEGLLTKPIDFGTLRSEIDSRIERAT